MLQSLYPQGVRASSTNWTEGWVGPRAASGCGSEERNTIFAPAENLTLVVHAIAFLYTD
jgi:hypothetical protein